MNGRLFICSGPWGSSVVQARDAKHARRIYAKVWLQRHGEVCNRAAVLRLSKGVAVGLKQ